MMDKVKINRALLSVSDKEGIADMAAALARCGCEIISTGGTGALLRDTGIPFTDISSVTGNPEAFGGRMKTISFQIESALLFNRETDADEAARYGIAPIDMVICNLYPFEKYLARQAAFEQLIEQIDIGGPTMIRAAAKNFTYVAVVTHPTDYPAVMAELEEHEGCLSYTTRKKLMSKAFNLTADYDACIAQEMDKACGQSSLRLAFSARLPLRYGENSHQEASLLRLNSAKHSIADLHTHHGIELSYNNILDVSSAIETVLSLERTGCVIVKHNNPCGMAEADDLARCFELAWQGDSISAFGGIVAFNETLDRHALGLLFFDADDKTKRKFIEVIAAPSFEPGALEYLATQKNLRVVSFDKSIFAPDKDYRFLHSGLLEQSPDTVLSTELKVATDAPFETGKMKKLIRFGLKAVRQIKSNAIVVAMRHQDGSLQMIGMGSGQPNRLHATQLALTKAESALGVSTLDGIPDCILFSDAFFPFEDNVELAHKHGIRIIVQPGGSIRDSRVIAKCNELSMTLILSGIRHFKH